MHGDEKRWWDVLSVGCPRDADPMDWTGTLADELAKLSPDDILRFDHWMNEQDDLAYSHDLWEAADLINGGASDDGFFYFRLWLLGMGKAVFEAALENPDSLADVVDPETDAYEASIFGVAREAWCHVMGKDPYREPDEYAAAYDALIRPRRKTQKLRGKKWRSHSNSVLRRRFPRLAALYLDDDE